MVHIAPFSLAAMSLLTLAATAPTAATTEPVFSFAKWVDDVIANPETALIPEEAWQAYLDTANSTSVPIAAPDGAEKRWDPEVSCNNYDPGPAWAPDAVWCINDLAAKGSIRTHVSVDRKLISALMEERGSRTFINPPMGGWIRRVPVAHTAGLIMDTCTGPDQYVEGSRRNVNFEA